LLREELKNGELQEQPQNSNISQARSVNQSQHGAGNNNNQYENIRQPNLSSEPFVPYPQHN
jgi:hypothetical protein